MHFYLFDAYIARLYHIEDGYKSKIDNEGIEILE
jgi:hypothetical protein